MYRELPDESGWYWVEETGGNWSMAHLSLDGDDPSVQVLVVDHDRARHECRSWRFVEQDGEWDCKNHPGDAFDPVTWHGPIKCPGESEVGEVTVLISDADYRRASLAGEAVVVRVADFRECKDERGAGRVTVVGVVGRQAAYDAVAGTP